MALPQREADYTFADYLAWDGKERIELIEGELVMQAAPSLAHQRVVRKLISALSQYLDGRKCEPIVAPFAVQLFADRRTPDNRVKTVVEPDIMVVCDPEKLQKPNCVTGAPDLIIEVLSPSTRRHDRLVKFNLYWHAGVREYWIVDPIGKWVQAFLLVNGVYQQVNVGYEGDSLRVNILDDCTIDLGAVFSE